MTEIYYTGKKASKLLGVHQRTLHNWDRAGKIEVKRSPGGHRLYNVKKFLAERNKSTGCKICYIRVSSKSQKDDLSNQRKKMERDYPDHEIISDIGSALNFNRSGLLKIINLTLNGEIQELVIAHRDRLARFGYELIQYLIQKQCGIEITVLSSSNKKSEPKEEMVEDILSIMNVFTAKINGMRKYK